MSWQLVSTRRWRYSRRMQLLLIALSGALGALGRHGIGSWSSGRFGSHFPYGTLIVNAAGSLLLGFVMGLALSGAISERSRLAIGTGFCGAFTTFSTFSYETTQLLREGAFIQALTNVGANLALGLAAVMLGVYAARLVQPT